MSPHACPDPSKEQLRRHFRRQRRECLPAATAGILATAQQQLQDLSGRSGLLGLYWPMGSEPDLRPLAPDLAGRLALPAVLSAAGLVYLPWQPGDPLEADACGIPAPRAQAGSGGEGRALKPAAMALLLVPALAIDPTGLRLGSGGGWYDRLRADPAWAQVPALAVLPSGCVVPHLPRDAWDVPFDGWLDEWGCHLSDAAGQKIARS